MIWGRRIEIECTRRPPVHMHDMHELVICLSDAGQHAVEGARHTFQPGRTFFLPGGTSHRVIPDSARPAEIQFVCFDQESLLEFAPPTVVKTLASLIEKRLFIAGPDQKICKENVLLSTMLHKELEQVGRLSQEMAGCLICSLLINHWRSLQLALDDSLDPEDRRLEQVCQRILENPARSITTDHIARDAGMSRATFTRKFRATTGMSLVEFVRSARIKAAMRLLTDTSMDVCAIAYQCGFDNLGYFYRTFREQTQRTPGQFRKELHSLGRPLQILRELSPMPERR